MVDPYILKNYVADDYDNPKLFREEYCFMCGHHLPHNQSMKVGFDWVHTDIRICLALTKRHDLRRLTGWDDY